MLSVERRTEQAKIHIVQIAEVAHVLFVTILPRKVRQWTDQVFVAEIEACLGRDLGLRFKAVWIYRRILSVLCVLFQQHFVQQLRAPVKLAHQSAHEFGRLQRIALVGMGIGFSQLSVETAIP